MFHGRTLKHVNQIRIYLRTVAISPISRKKETKIATLIRSHENNPPTKQTIRLTGFFRGLHFIEWTISTMQ